MKTISKIRKVVEVITRIFGYLAAIALLANVVIIMANIILRAGGSSVVGAEEYVSLFQVAVIFLALGYTQHNHGLVHVAFFMKKLPAKLPMILWTIHAWVGTVIVYILCSQTLKRIPAVKQVTQSLLLPLKPWYIVLLVGCIVYFIAQLFDAVMSTVGLFNKEVGDEVKANWPA